MQKKDAILVLTFLGESFKQGDTAPVLSDAAEKAVADHPDYQGVDEVLADALKAAEDDAIENGDGPTTDPIEDTNASPGDEVELVALVYLEIGPQTNRTQVFPGKTFLTDQPDYYRSRAYACSADELATEDAE